MEAIEVSGIVILSQPMGEADRRVVLLTERLGRISAFAKGARRQTSSLVAATRTFAFGKFYIYPGKNSYSLYRAEITNYFEEVVGDMEAMAYGCYFLELASYFTRENEDCREMLNLIYYSLKALMNPRLKNSLVKRIFEFRSLKIFGVAPSFLTCATCGKKLREGSFDPKSMGCVCTSCAEGKGAYYLSQSSIYALNFIACTDIGKLFTFSVTDTVYQEISKVIRYLREEVVEKELQALNMLRVFVDENA